MEQKARSEFIYFRCPVCGQSQPFLCPGFGQHTPSQTLTRQNGHIVCTQCAHTLSNVTCTICHEVTALTPDIVADPTGKRYPIGEKEFAQAQTYRETNQRYMQMRIRMQNSTSFDERDVIAMKGLLANSEWLFARLPQRYPFVNPRLVQLQIANIASWLAKIYGGLLNNEQAMLYSQRAAHIYEQTGNQAEAEDCYRYMAQIHLRDEGIVDEEVQRLHAQIEREPEDSFKRISLFVELGSLHMQIGDNFEAERVLLTAEKAFDGIQLFDSSGHCRTDILADAGFPMSDAFAQRPEAEEAKRTFLLASVSSLRERLYADLSTVYREKDFAKVTHYFQLAIQQQESDLHPLLELQYAFDMLYHNMQHLQDVKIEQEGRCVALLQNARTLEATSRASGTIEGISSALLQQGRLLIIQHQYDEAIVVLLKARAVLQDHWVHDRGVQILVSLAEAYARKQQWQKVSDVCEEGIDLVEIYRYKVTGQYMQSAYLISRIALYSWGARAAFELKDYDLMLKRAELSKCRSILRYNQHVYVTSQHMQDVEHQFQHVCEQIDAADPNSPYLTELQQRRRTLWDILLIQRFQARTGESFPIFSLLDVQATLAEDEAILYYYWLSHSTLLIVAIDRQRIIPVLRDVAEEQHEALQKFARVVLQPPTPASVSSSTVSLPSYLDTVQDFSDLLLPEEAHALLAGKQRLLVSPHRFLHALPFHALRWQGRFLIRHFAVTSIPNLSSLLISATPTVQQKVFALGIRDYEVPGVVLKSLPQTEQEVDTVQQLYSKESVPVLAFKGPDARIERVRQLETKGMMKQFSCLHFATHGFNVDSDTPMESYLFLRDTRLSGLEIANWQLNTDIVVLSACSSGQRPVSGRDMSELPGDELFGLQAAFFTAGAKKIVSCLWPIVDTIAAQMTQTFHQRLLEGKSPERALQAAMNDYLDTAKFSKKSVYHWAPFFLSSMGRSMQ